jgi:hypothetical protein
VLSVVKQWSVFGLATEVGGVVLIDVLHVFFVFEFGKKKKQAELEEKEMHLAHILH